MFEEMNRELELLQIGRCRYGKIESMLSSLKQQLGEQEDTELKYKKELGKEEVDVEKFNRNNLTSIFYTILGSKEEQIEKERQDVLAAQLKYDNIVGQIEDTKHQISKLEAEKKELAHCEREYNELFEKKYQMLMQSDRLNAEKISTMEQNISATKANIAEIEEAISAGDQVLDALRNTEDSLDSAEGWGVWDMWGGGGLITDMIKHSHIDEARNTASEVQSLLNHFRTELTDVKVASQINIEIEGFAKFADYFFDGLIADWVIQSRINDSIESVNRVKGEVNSVLSQLQRMKDADETNIVNIKEELSNLVARA